MRVVGLYVENFKPIRVIEIEPDGNVVTIGGKNGQGKSSVMDAIWVALEGKTVAPPKPIRNGTQQALIRLNLGELLVTRTFKDKGDGSKMTDTLKVQDPEGRIYPSPQKVLDELLGEIGFDPFGFVQMKPDEQADTLRRMVPLTVDLDELAAEDLRDKENRRDINRDGKALVAQFEAIPEYANPPELVDRDALVEQLTGAADTNSAIDREQNARDRVATDIANEVAAAARCRENAKQLRRQADEQDALATAAEEHSEEWQAALDARDPLETKVDTQALRQKITDAEAAAKIHASIAERKRLDGEIKAKRVKSEALTAAIEGRETARQKALAEAKMPIDGLSFAIEDGKQRVMFNGVPFEQASSAEQLRASTAIAMAANPTLRVLRIKDGSLLDDDSMAMIASMAEADDFQLWIERVGTGGVGIVIEDGAVKGAPVAQPEPNQEEKPKAKAKKPAAEKPEGSLL